MRNRTKVNNLFAFWSYDLFPYVLGDDVESMTDKGNVIPKHYGGYAFRPIKLMPTASGRALYKQIEKLGAEYRAASKKLLAEHVTKLHVLLPESKE